MALPKVNVVWLKRDLRSQDHEPLYVAQNEAIPYIVLYIFEPEIIAHPDCSLRHLQFIYGSVKELELVLLKNERSLSLCYGQAKEIFTQLLKDFNLQTVFSYQESGVALTWQRDKAITKLLKAQGVHWKQFKREGVLRGIQNRDGWDKQWYVTMHQPLLENSYSANLNLDWNHNYKLPKQLQESWQSYPQGMQPPGEQAAWKYLYTFATNRGVGYMRHISKPNESRISGSRLSPYLAWGNLSVKQVYQFVQGHPNRSKHKRAFQGFLTRLKWRSHFIQKFEVECEYETLCINRGYESLSYVLDLDRIKAWEEGKTGYPMVDANMRCLRATGWINFRMRAMLVSFFCHHLGQDWKLGVYHLARLFLDYEPGIHYPQFQMQAGTTGINTVRMYNPVKQGCDHDPEGIFVKKWVPELEGLPVSHIHEPWNLTALEATLYNFELGKDYPKPIVDLTTAGKEARARIYGHRKTPEVEQEKKRILKTHTRNSNR